MNSLALTTRRDFLRRSTVPIAGGSLLEAEAKYLPAHLA
jgi:hypothetical protein